MQTVVEEPSDCFTSSREDADGVSLRELEPPSRRAHIPGFELSTEDHPRHESDGHSQHGPNIVVLSMGQRNSTNQRIDCEELELREQSKSARVPRSTYFGDANPHIFMKDGKTTDKHLGGTPTFGDYQPNENHYIHEEEQFSLETPGFLVLCLENPASAPINCFHLKRPPTLTKNSQKSKTKDREVRDITSKPLYQHGHEPDHSNNGASRRQSSETIQDEWSKRVAALKSLSHKINEKMNHLPESSSRKALEAILSNLNKEQFQLEEMISESSLTEASELYLKYRTQSIDFTLAKKSTGEVKTPANGYPTQAGSVVSTLPLNSTKDISLLEAAFVERRRRNTIDGDSICKSGAEPPSKIEKCDSMLEERASNSSSYKPEAVYQNPKSYLAPEDIQLLRSLLSSEFPEIEPSKLNLDREIESVKNQVRDGLGRLDNHIGGFSDAYAVALSIKAGSRAGSQASYGGRRQRIGDKKPLDVFTNQDETSHDYSSATLPSHHAKSSGVVHPSHPIRQSMGDDLSPMSQKENDCKPNEARLFQKKKLSAKLKNTLVTPGFKMDTQECAINPAKQLNALLQYSKDDLMRAKSPTTLGPACSSANKLITKKSGQNSTKSSIGLNPSMHLDPHMKQGEKFAKRQKSPFGKVNPTKFSRAMELSQNQSFSSSAQRQSTSRVGSKHIAALNHIGGPQYREPTKDTSHLQGTHRVAGSVKLISSINSIQGFHQVMLKQSRAKSAPRGYLLSDTNGDLSISTDGRTQRIAELEELDRIQLSNIVTDVQYFSTHDQLTTSIPGRNSQMIDQNPSSGSPKKSKPSVLNDMHKSSLIQTNYPLTNLNSAGLASSVANILKQVRKNSATAGLVKSTSVKSNKSSQLHNSMKGGQRSGLISSSQGHPEILALVSPKNQTTRFALSGSNKQLFAAESTKEKSRIQGTSVKGLQEPPQMNQSQLQKHQTQGSTGTGTVSDPLERRKELEAILAESKRVHELNKKFGDASIAQWKSLAVPVMPGELGDLRKRSGGATSPTGVLQGGLTVAGRSSSKIKATNQN